MDAGPKKISFGFSKLTKKPAVILNSRPKEKKLDLIDCLEGQSIKIKDAVEKVYQPLVIPIKDDQKNLLDRVKEARMKQSNSLRGKETKEVVDERPDSELTIEELAARELIKDAKQRLEQSTNTTSKVFMLPAVEDKLELTGEAEPTLDDYENVPINDFGLAMLRGMGWKEGSAVGKDPSKSSMASVPELRPKGLGLGATREIKKDKIPAVDKEGKEMLLIKGAFAKIIAGAHKGSYCEVQGLDDEAGRVIVKTSLKSEILNVNEFLLVPVTKEEYAKGSKVINNAKYEEYKEIMEKKLEKEREKVKKEEVLVIDSDDEEKRDRTRNKYSVKEEKHRDNSKYEKDTRKKYGDYRSKASSSKKIDYDSSDDDRRRRRDVRKYDSDSDGDRYRRRSRSKSHEKKVKKSKHKKKSRSSSEESSDYERKKKKKKKKSKHRSSSESEREYRRDHKSRR